MAAEAYAMELQEQRLAQFAAMAPVPKAMAVPPLIGSAASMPVGSTSAMSTSSAGRLAAMEAQLQLQASEHKAAVDSERLTAEVEAAEMAASLEVREAKLIAAEQQLQMRFRMEDMELRLARAEMSQQVAPASRVQMSQQVAPASGSFAPATPPLHPWHGETVSINSTPPATVNALPQNLSGNQVQHMEPDVLEGFWNCQASGSLPALGDRQQQ